MITIGVDDVPAWITERSNEVRRFLFGVAGAPGAGKSTLAAQLSSTLAAPIVAMDGFHLPNAVLDARGLRSRKGAPETFAAERFVDLVRALRDATTAVSCPVFDRVLGEPVENGARIAPDCSLVIVEGNYLLLDEPPWVELVDLLDAVAYLEVDGDLRRQRLVDRHVSFGRSRTDAVEFVHRSDEANAQRVVASRGRAHLVVTDSVATHCSPAVESEWSADET